MPHAGAKPHHGPSPGTAHGTAGAALAQGLGQRKVCRLIRPHAAIEENREHEGHPTPLCFRRQSQVLFAKAEIELLLSSPILVIFWFIFFWFSPHRTAQGREEPVQGNHLTHEYRGLE